MDGSLAQLQVQLTRLEAKVDRLIGKPKAHLKCVQFAKEVGVHPNTVSRWIAAGRILKEKGRIPVTELAKFTSADT